MAAWQFDLYLIPEPIIHSGRQSVAAALRESSITSVEWESDAGISPQLAREILKLLPEGRPWLEKMRTWGTEDGNRVDVLYEEGQVREVFVRIDLREPSFDFIKGVVALASKLGCVLLTTDYKLVKPNLDGLVSVLKESKAAQFVTDPQRFLEQLKI